MSNSIIKKISIGIFFLIFNINLIASHFAGSDLTFKCVGGNDYLITLAFYRDCSGVSMSGYIPATVNFQCSSNAAFNFSAQLNLIAGSPIEITEACSSMPTKCAIPSSYGFGIQEYIMQATVTLAPCNSWTISYTNNARNPVTTVQNNGSNSWYIMATLNNLTAPCNSSPYFTNKPVGIVCLNQHFCYNHGAIDQNGDSLVYSFYSPKTTSPTATVNYLIPYTYLNFLQSNPPISFDSITGDICFTPTAILSTITGIKVEEYRKINNVYVMIGSVMRDMELFVNICDNTLPVISGMDTTGSHHYNPNDSIYWLETCYEPNKVISFDINGFDADSLNPASSGNAEIFNITWNNGIPQGNFQAFNNNTDSAYAHFNWTLQPSDISNLPKCFTATVSDKACPYHGLQTFSYCITVRGMEVKIGSDTLICAGESVTYTAIADTTTQNYLWTLNGSNTGTPFAQDTYTFNSSGKIPGVYTIGIETNDGGTTVKCPGKDFAVVNVVYQPDIQGKLLDSTFCKPGSILYDAGQGAKYIWMDQSAGIQGVSNTINISNSGIYSVFVDGGNNTRCFDSDTFQVFAIEKPNLGVDTCIWSSGANPEFTLIADPIETGLAYVWSTNSTANNIGINISGTYSLSVYHPNINSNLKCSDEKVVNIIDKNTFIQSIKIQTDNNPLEGELDSIGDRNICNHQKLKLFGPTPPDGHSYDYSWNQDGTNVSITPYYIFKEKAIKTYEVQLTVAPGCTDKININTEYCEVKAPNVFTPNNDLWNEKFVFKGLENYPSSTLIIYNRWGKKIFESKNYMNDWDAKNVADGVYFWKLKIKDDENTEFQGTVTILRK